jgi:hypothetical protein
VTAHTCDREHANLSNQALGFPGETFASSVSSKPLPDRHDFTGYKITELNAARSRQLQAEEFQFSKLFKSSFLDLSLIGHIFCAKRCTIFIHDCSTDARESYAAASGEAD